MTGLQRSVLPIVGDAQYLLCRRRKTALLQEMTHRRKCQNGGCTRPPLGREGPELGILTSDASVEHGLAGTRQTEPERAWDHPTRQTFRVQSTRGANAERDWLIPTKIGPE